MNEIKILVGLIALGGLVWLVWFWRRSSAVPLLEETKQKVERDLTRPNARRLSGLAKGCIPLFTGL